MLCDLTFTAHNLIPVTARWWLSSGSQEEKRNGESTHKTIIGSFVKEGWQHFSPLKISGPTYTEIQHHDLFYTDKNNIQPLGHFCNLPHTCPSVSHRDELLKTLLLMLFHIWQANNQLHCEMRSTCPHKWPLTGQRMEHSQHHHLNWGKLSTPIQSAAVGSAQPAVTNKCSQDHYFNRCCTSMFFF